MITQPRLNFVLLSAAFATTLLHCNRTAPEPAKTERAVQEVKITVKGEYSPDRITVKKDRSVRLMFYREDDSDCTAEVVFPDFNVKKELAVKKETVVELIPQKEGEFTFACGMDMLKGKLVVEK
ncbi:MAG: cupredoxin domain-containing protein [Acidobacteria bacterium]|nr:cupredoxin domain-containing protein [Acidobacteriota bacterium]MCI0623465.1 cupredoxin domain-containing protein [Acidobacteriota bacterium]MCI0723985.1 cupredoxin domain-containing protein [Acidobacteriota bacterium]